MRDDELDGNITVIDVLRRKDLFCRGHESKVEEKYRREGKSNNGLGMWCISDFLHTFVRRWGQQVPQDHQEQGWPKKGRARHSVGSGAGQRDGDICAGIREVVEVGLPVPRRVVEGVGGRSAWGLTPAWRN